MIDPGKETEVCVMTSPGPLYRRRGISLLEVLISIGILSIGLASVLALLPAGGSQARRAMIEDRKSALGSAAIAECRTRGFLNPLAWSGTTAPPVMIDPLGQAFNVAASPTGLPIVAITGLSSPAMAEQIFRGGDDLAVQIPEDDSLPPVMLTQNGVRRLTEGSFSWLATIVPARAGGAATPFNRLSIVEFYRRSFEAGSGETSQSFPAQFAGPSITIDNPGIVKDQFKLFFPTGGAVLAAMGSEYRWMRVLMAAPTYGVDENTVTSIDLSVNVDIGSGNGTVMAYGGAVGVTEQLVRLEEPAP
jgi:hypothetical protein